MAKIGRNDKCPCQSGKKFKRCCGRGGSRPVQAKTRPATEKDVQITLMDGVEVIQGLAEKRMEATRELGVFFFFSTAEGDAWLLEMTDQDCVKVAEDGKRLSPPIDESPETIEVNWSHTFAINNRMLELTAYSDKEVMVLEDAPAQKINAMAKRIKKKFSDEQLRQVHVEQ